MDRAAPAHQALGPLAAHVWRSRWFPCRGVVLATVLFVASCATNPIVVEEGIRAEGLQRVVDETSAVRELPVRSPVIAKTSNQEKLRDYLQTLWKAERKRADDEDRLFHRLGLATGPRRPKNPPRASPLIGGYYDPKSATLFVIEDYAFWIRAQYLLLTAITGNDWAYDAVLSHEIVHALQDQQFSLDHVLAGVGPTDPFEIGWAETHDFDRALARRALLESDASLASAFYGNAISPKGALRRRIVLGYTRFNYWVSDVILGAVASGESRFAERRALGNYTLGLDSLERLLDRGGFAELNRLYAGQELPESTEQLLDPRKFLDDDHYDPPIDLSPLPPESLGEPGWTSTISNTFGAWQLKLLLDESHRFGFAPDAIARAWGGDRYTFLKRGDETIFVWRLAFDDEETAENFFDAWMSALGPRYGERLSSWTRADDGNQVCAEVEAGGESGVYTATPESLCVSRDGVRVLIVEGARPKNAAVLTTSIWETHFATVSLAKSGRGVQRRSLLATPSVEVPLPPPAELLLPSARRISLRLGVRARLRPGDTESGFALVPDFAAAWTARPGLMLSLPFAVTVAVPLMRKRTSTSSPTGLETIVPTLSVGALRGSFSEPAAAFGLQATLDPGMVLAGHAQIAVRDVFRAQREWHARVGGGLLVRLGSRVRFAPAVALTATRPFAPEASNPAIGSPPIGSTPWPTPRLEFGASHLRGLTRHPLVEVQLFDALSATFDTAYVVDLTHPMLIEHTHALGLALLF